MPTAKIPSEGPFAARETQIRLEEELNRLPDPAHKKVLRRLAAHRRHGRILRTIFAYSPFLRAAIAANIKFLDALCRTPAEKAVATICKQVDTEFSSLQELMRTLRLARGKVALAVAWEELGGAPLEATTALLSAFAAAAVRAAVNFLLRRNAAALGITAAEVADCGYAVFAMGKLGALELNYSSDIDLVAFYDSRAGISEKRAVKVFPRITQELLTTLSARTAQGYVFRTDLRLRPDPASTPAALSLAAAEVYYETVGQNWERAALIKARPLAGDRKTAEDFSAMIEPFIWRRNLDFAALDDILSLRRQSTSAVEKKARADKVEGLNIKLAAGGIRDIEFFVQIRQLIWGGKVPSLRVAPTLQALRRLVQAEQLDETTATVLADNYRFLRHTEHRLQMVADSQTHQVPAAEEAKSAFAAFAGFPSFAAFAEELSRTIAATTEILNEFYRPQKPLGGSGSLSFIGTQPNPQTLKTLREMGFADYHAAWKTVAGWHFGRAAATRSERARQLLTELTPTLLEAFAATASADKALEGFNHFLLGLPAGVQVFSLLMANSKLIELLAQVIGTAPRQAARLTRNPAILESLLSSDFYRPMGDYRALENELSQALALAKNEEPQVVMRRWAKDRKFQLAVQLLTNQTDAWAATDHYTNIADIILEREHGIICGEFAKTYGRIDGELAIVALGKLGARRLTGASDLDLVFIHSDGAATTAGERKLSAQTYFNRLAQRIIGALATKSAEGELYTVDMRLRPSGEDGAIAVPLHGFVAYQRAAAEFWEKMALCKARVVVASPKFKRAIERGLARILSEPEDPSDLKRKLLALQRRIGKEHGRDDPWQLKYMGGGLLDLDFLIQFFCRTEPKLLNSDPTEALALIAEAELLPKTEADGLLDAYKLWCRLDGLKRLCLSSVADPRDFGESLRQKLAATAEVTDFSELTAKIEKTRSLVLAIFRRVIG